MKHLLTISLAIILLACSTDDPPIASTSFLVVEGWLTDQDTPQYVRLTRSQEFLSTEANNFVSDAEIQVRSSRSEQFTFSHQSNGLYLSDVPFAGRPNTSYWVRISLSNGSTVESDLEMLPTTTTIDSLAFDFYLRPSEDDPQIDERVYYPIAFSKDDGSLRNYYRWKLYKNDTLFADPEHLILLSDRFFDGNAYQNDFTNFEYKLGDKITVEKLEISQNAYEYLSLLKSQTTTLGTVSSVSPAPVKGNLHYLSSTTQVLGYYGVASVRQDSLTIN
ncbi:DUF4249 domain-containing protein [Marinoscillum sp.]|uniref:DUF4249 domain-containing protein n=1 Tax=Marinoscillum sp. TaxID=2024838 RepID=UPI003BABA4EA